jgi:hypothetical protein
VAKVEVPVGGVESQLTEEELSANLDPKPAPKPKKTAMMTPGVFQRRVAQGAE